MKKPYLIKLETLEHASLELTWSKTIYTEAGPITFEVMFNGFYYWSAKWVDNKRLYIASKEGTMGTAVDLTLQHFGVPDDERAVIVPKICAGFLREHKSVKPE